MSTMHNVLPQGHYILLTDLSKKEKAEFAKMLSPEDMARFQKFERRPDTYVEALQEQAYRAKAAKAYISACAEKYHGGNGPLAKAGVTTGTGFNFYDLRPPVALLSPLNVPFRNSLTRYPRVNDGFGTAAHWMASRQFGTAWGGVPEGQRNATSTPDNNQYVATYKEIGVERAATFTSQFASEGFTDVVADEHLRGLYSLWLQQESIMLFGNGGTSTGNNGFALGTPATPTLTAAAGGFANSTNVSVAVVALTALGFPNNAQYGLLGAGGPPTIAGGLTPSYTRVSAAGESVTINGGISAISAMSAVTSVGGGLGKITATVAPIRGAIAWAWYVNTTDAAAPSLANAKLAAFTTVPNYTFGVAPTSTNQNGAAAGLNADHSFEPTSYDGLWTYMCQAGSGFGTSCSATGSYMNDLNGGSFTVIKAGGQINEIENVLAFIWNNQQARVTKIWAATDAKQAFDAAVIYSGAGAGTIRFVYERDQQGNLLGGFTVSGYKSKYAINDQGGDVIPVILHPMMPAGCMFFDIETNPYPESRVPFVRGMLTQRDYYSIEWPVTTRNWTFGVYTHELLQHWMPWLSAGLSGIGPFNQSQ